MKKIISLALISLLLILLQTTGDWLRRNPGRVNGIFLTQMHFDHVMGGTDFPGDVPLYAGPGETAFRSVSNLFLQDSIDRMLGKGKVIRELAFGKPDSAGFITSPPGNTPRTWRPIAGI